VKWVQIGGLGAVHANLGSPKGTLQEKRLGSFAGVLASFKNDKAAENEMAKETETVLPIEEIAELIQFLNTIDLSELDGGPELMEQVQTSAGENIFELVLHYLGIDEKKWSALVDRIDSFIVNAEGQQHASARNVEMVDFDHIASLLSMVVTILSSSEHSLTKDVADVAKAAKLYDLLSKHVESFYGKQDLHPLIKQVAEKLESFDFAVQQNGSKMEYLRKTFAPLAEQLNNNREILSNQNESASESKSNFFIKQDVLGTVFSLNQMSKAEQLALMLDETGKPATTEQFIQQFESILAKSRFTKIGGTQKLFLKLYPEHLGAVRIELIQKDQTIVARILTTNSTAKEALESQLQGLKQAFSSQNIQVDRIEISQQMTEQDRFFNRDSHQERQERQQEKQQENKDQENTKETALSFEQILLDMEV
jgi:flagellar hook-length control protein FliK